MKERRSESGPSVEARALEDLARERRRLLGFLVKLVGTTEAAEDILQSAYLKGIQKAGTLRSQTSVTAWFHRILRNAVVDHYRGKGREQKALAAFARELRGRSVDTEFRRAVCSCVRTAMRNLRPEYRKALQSLEVDGIGVAAWSRKTGITPNNARVRAHRARQALRRELLRICGVCAEHGCFDCDCPETKRAPMRARKGL